MPAERSFIGGLWSAKTSAIWPLVRLELSGPGISVRPSTRLLGWLIPAWDARYEEITRAHLISAPIASRGVCIHARTAAGPVVFWSRRGTQILDLLQLHGVPADWSVTQLAWGTHLDHP